MVKSQKLTEQEWSYFFDIDDIVKGRPTALTIEADDDECTDLARRFSVEAIKSAKADLTIEKTSGVIKVSGHFDCVVTQNCVVSMDAFDTQLSENVTGWFADKENTVSFAAAKKERAVAKHQAELEILDEKDDPEPVIDNQIDLGELTAQRRALRLSFSLTSLTAKCCVNNAQSVIHFIG